MKPVTRIASRTTTTLVNWSILLCSVDPFGDWLDLGQFKNSHVAALRELPQVFDVLVGAAVVELGAADPSPPLTLPAHS